MLMKTSVIFFSFYLLIGLREKEHPYSLLAEIGSMNMLENGGKNVVPVIPQLIIPLKNALNTRDPEVMNRTLMIIQKLVEADPFVGKVCLCML